MHFALNKYRFVGVLKRIFKVLARFGQRLGPTFSTTFDASSKSVDLLKLVFYVRKNTNFKDPKN